MRVAVNEKAKGGHSKWITARALYALDHSHGL
jgi:hypothetical protein